MLAFVGTELPAETARTTAARPVAGVTLFRHHNVKSPAQVRRLTDDLQAAAAPSDRPLLIATDQEGGQLIALGQQTTQFAGQMALGAAADEDLAERVARATGRELLAMGVNVNYAPVCDLATNPANPSLGIRSFGDDPDSVARLAAATVRGLQSEGVAATAKHFPGTGDSVVDPHHELALVKRDRQEMDRRELVPFRATFEAGARLVMAAHVALPAVTKDGVPASLSSVILRSMLRGELGFRGLTITDALDMGALAQSAAAQVANVVTAVGAGADFLLGTPDEALLARLEDGLAQAESRGVTDSATERDVLQRLASLRAWLSGFDQPSLDVVGCEEHQHLAAELARKSVTLVRNDDRLLPLTLPAEARIAVVQPRPTDLTPADTSSYVAPALATEVRRRFSSTHELLTSPLPTPAEIADVRSRLASYDLVVLGTTAAHLQPAQAELARAVLSLGRPTVTVALRTPWDLPEYEQSRTHVCTYGILPPSMEALAVALFGEIEFTGRLPVAMGGLYPRGYGLSVRGKVAAR